MSCLCPRLLAAVVAIVPCWALSGEPTTSAEARKAAAAKPADNAAAAEKAAAEQAVDASYQKLKATLPPAERAWEEVLEANLGGFYLPLHKRDRIAGRTTAWSFVADDPALPRVLLIGDSVSRGYTLAVRKALAGRANVHRAPENCGPTANGLKKLDVWLGSGRWDVVHFNFGIHDRKTPLPQYEERLEQIVARLRSTGARLIWAATTPVPPAKGLVPQEIVDRNAVAARVMQRRGVAVNDLYAFVLPELARLQNPDDCHFNTEGYNLLGKQVAAVIADALPKK